MALDNVWKGGFLPSYLPDQRLESACGCPRRRDAGNFARAPLSPTGPAPLSGTTGFRQLANISAPQ
eukprot:840701-Pyramimonas_sp.AAC.1